MTNPEIDLVYFIITKSVRGSNEKGIDPVGILIQGKYFKLMPKNSSASGSTFKEPADYSLNTHESRDKQKIVENFDSRFSKPKPVAGLLKAVKHFKEETHEKRPASNRFIRDDDLPSTYLGKRAAAPYQNNFLGETGEQNALASEYMSSAKLLKEAVQTSYDKILNDVTLQTSRKTNQALGAWPAGSESEKQANTSHQHLINFLTKQKGSSQNENKEPLDYLKDSSYRPQMSDLAKLGGFPKEPVDDRRMHLEERGFSYEHEVPEHRESTLKKAINAINKTKFKQGSTFYESPKLNEHPTLPSVFNGGGF